MATELTFIDFSRTFQTASEVHGKVSTVKTVKPTYRLVANDQDITDIIKDRLSSLRFTDAVGFESDMLEINLTDHKDDEPIALPPTGAELQLFLGYDDVADLKGIFVVDELNMGGGAGKIGYMTIRARATPYDRSKGGKSTLQSQKRRIWKRGTRVGDMVAKIAKEHGMEHAVSGSLKNVLLPTIDQSNESDINLLLRLAKKYDAMVKPAGGKLIFAKRGEMKTLGGEPFPTVTVMLNDVTEWEMQLTMRESSGTVVATWSVPKSAMKYHVKVGSGEPVTRIRTSFPNREAALSAAKAEFAKRQRAGTRLRVSMPGRNDVIAEAPLALSGWRRDVPTKWLVTNVEHSLGADGWRLDVQAELQSDFDEFVVVDVKVNKA